MGPKNALQDVIETYPSLVAFARAVGVTRATVYVWLRSQVSTDGALAIQRVTRLDPYLLRPDVFQRPRKKKAAA
jgi:DNA-binding transcriptional regulator YdaS (Cro superfamily)